jgi:hypothetical protein
MATFYELSVREKAKSIRQRVSVYESIITSGVLGI